MKKVFAVFLVAMLCIAGAFAGGSSEDDGNTYKIGFIGPLTGDNANYGIRCSNAARLAIDEINEAGGVNGKMLELIAEDSEGTVDKAIASYEKLAYSDNVFAIIGPVFTSPALAVAQRCMEDGIVMISPSATHKDVTNQDRTNPDGKNYVFRTVPSDSLQSEVAAYYFYQVLGYRNLAMLYAMNDYSQGLAMGLEETFTSLGGNIVASETCMVGDKDFRTQLARIKSANPEAVYIPNYTVEDAQILEQGAQLGVGPYLSSDGFSDPMIYQLAGDYTDGVIYVGPAQAEASTILTDFQAAYREAYNGDEADSFATNSYDATYILADSIKRAGEGVDRSTLRDQVEATTDFAGANGIINFAENGDLVASQGVYDVEGTTPVYVGAFQVQNGQIVQVD